MGIPLPKAVWEVEAEVAYRLRCRRRPRTVRGHRLSRAAVLRPTRRQLSQSRSGRCGLFLIVPLIVPVAQGPRGEAEPPQEVLAARVLAAEALEEGTD